MRKRILQFVLQHRLELLLTLFIAALYFWVYLNDPKHPTSMGSRGWLGWFDQSSYLTMVNHFPFFTGKGGFLYGPGYPFFGALFRNITPVNPFLIPNLIFAVVAGLMIFWISQNFMSKRFSAFSTAIMFLLTPVMYFFVVPWNTAISLVAGLICVFVLFSQKLSHKNMILVGLSLGFVYAARYVDVLWLMPIVGMFFLMQWRQNGLKILIRPIIVCLIPLCLVVGFTMWAHHEFRGGGYFNTPFSTRNTKIEGVSEQSLVYYQLWKIPHTFKDVFIYYRGKDWNKALQMYQKPLLVQSPFLALMPLGFILIWRKFKSYHWQLTALALSCVLAVAFYLSFPPFTGYGLLFSNMRYVMMWVPYFWIFSFVGLLWIFGMWGKDEDH